MPLDARTDNVLPRTAMKAEMLDAETELKLAYAWRDERCEQSLHRLTESVAQRPENLKGATESLLCGKRRRAARRRRRRSSP